MGREGGGVVAKGGEGRNGDVWVRVRGAGIGVGG